MPVHGRRTAATAAALLLSIGSALLSIGAHAFVPRFPPSSPSTYPIAATSVTEIDTNDDSDGDDVFSTLSLIEHVNLNVPDHRFALPFYFDLLGLGLDPRRAQNVAPGTGTLWFNCGASQFHLPHGDTAQVLPGHVGLRYDSLEGLKERVRRAEEETSDAEDRCYTSAVVGTDRSGRECVTVVDKYGNTFACRAAPGGDEDGTTRCQPVVSPSNPEHAKQFGEELVERAGEKSECRGIDFVEFKAPRGTAKRIGTFYECVFDATVSVLQDGDDMVTVVGCGRIDSDTGRAAQTLLFRETDEQIPEYDGHHIAVYVGKSGADFEKAFENCNQAGVVWVNPRFKDKATDLEGAIRERQFRFKDVLDLRSGKKVFELEHEVRSVEHGSWLG